jgi:hypothetical protein
VIENAFAWCEERRSGLSDEFLEEVDATVAGRIRRAVVHRFPYLLFYVIDPHEIVVLACMHASRDPKSWPGAHARKP